MLSHEHFTVDGTLLEAWASHKSFRPKDDPTPPPSDGDPKNPTISFRKEKRSNTTHASLTDPDSRLARKSHNTAALLSHLGSVLMDNRHGLIVATEVRPPDYHAERDAGVEMLTTLEPRARRRTLGADKGYDTPDFVQGVRACATTPHVSPNLHARRPRSAIDGRTTRRAGFAVSQVKRKLVEEGFGWSKTIGGLKQTASSGPGESRVDLYLHERRVQPRPDANADPRRGLRVSAARSLVRGPLALLDLTRRAKQVREACSPDHPRSVASVARSDCADVITFSATC